jgi:hypothetical protein
LDGVGWGGGAGTRPAVKGGGRVAPSTSGTVKERPSATNSAGVARVTNEVA